MKNSLTFLALICVAMLVGCGQAPEPTASSNDNTGTSSTSSTPAVTHVQPSDVLGPVTLGPSEYPSWVVFKVAGRAGLINPVAGGEHGPLEVKHGVDIVIDYTDYDSCLANYGNGKIQAVCVTNGDALTLVQEQPGVGFLPTSTSNGADAVLAYDVTELSELKGVPVKGLGESVSQFAYIRILQTKGLNPADFPFENMDPEAAAIALQSNTDGSGDVQAGMLWNPYVIQTQSRNSKVNLVGDTRLIPEEVVDCVVMAQSTANTEAGKRCQRLICDIYYTISAELSGEKASTMRTELGKDFAGLDSQTMVTILQQTAYYATPQDGRRVFDSVGFQDIMGEQGVVPQTYVLMNKLDRNNLPTVSFDGSDANLQFSTDAMQYIQDTGFGINK